MPIVKIMKHCQVAIPKELFEQLHLEVGDYLEAKIENGQLIYSPQELLPRQVEQAIEKAFEEIKLGKTKRFKDVEALIEELNN
uniref:Hypothetical conserved protein n=1 Tax=Acetithermum autotrophicum TaxID=1446466 RepID=H5SQL4_ACEAU|nr:hypothetical conserved protein [Candidatus Acetothermum autotrophicum]